ncbi:MAG: choice-of-anchor L domain-containing protein [Chitinophagales bacterium]|nr:choice-of-anchor L domain-containing protein [Chitinophagales bacterium]
MTKKVLCSVFALTTLFAVKLQAQIAITQTNNATTLAQSLVGTGITISGATTTGTATQFGTFTNGNSVNLGFNSGVVLTSGNVADIPQNGTALASVDNPSAGDADLNAISTGATQDAAVLQFNIVPQGNTLTFRYVFASEEYPEYVCSSFNDIFAFLISGPNPGGGNYNKSNIALIPNTGLSVAINTVNPGVVGANGTASQCQSLAYSQYYLDNQNGVGIVYDGKTVVLNATISVVPCSTYTLKMAIADVFDGVLDSGVFIEAQSFTSQSSTLTAAIDAGFTSTFEGCVGGVFTITVPTLATTSTAINYTVSGTATNGVDYSPLSGTAYVNPGTSTALVYVNPLTDNLAEGTETVTITINDPCTGLPIASATINIEDKPIDTAYASAYDVCVGGQVQLTATGGGTYSWTPTTGLSDPNIASPVATVTGNITYTAQITFGSCVSQKSVTLNASSITVDVLTADGIICPGDLDSLYADTDGGIQPVSYQWSPAGMVTDPNAQLTFTSPMNTTTYTVVVTDAIGCTATDSYTISVSNTIFETLGGNVNVCPEDAPYILSVPGGPYDSYIWSTGDTTATITVSTTGSYSATMTLGFCTITTDTATITMLVPVNPTLADAFFCSGSQATLQANQGLTNIVWNTNETTQNISVTSPGEYYYTADDANGCAVYSDTATVTEIQSPVVNATASPDTICPGSSSVLNSGAQTGFSVNWSTNENTSSITVTSGGTYYVTVSDAVCSSYDTVTVYEYANPQPLIGADTTVCNGEAATFTLLNGPFVSYTWSEGSTGVTSITVSTAGSYNLTVNDGICNWTSNSVSLNNFPTPVPTLADTGACVGETVTLSAENGLLNIEWNTQEATQTITVTQNGTFYYTAVDANGCPVASDTIDVTFQVPPTVNATASPDTICPGATTTLSANATGNNLTYLWTPTGGTGATETVSQPGTYIVEVNDFFCPAFDTVEVYQYQFPEPNIGYDQTICLGDSITLSPTDGPYLSYDWSNGDSTETVTVGAQGTYNVIVDNGTCLLVSNTITLDFHPGSTPALFDSTLCEGGVVMLTVEQGSFDILWSNGSTADTIYVTTSGNYSYTGASQYECPLASDTATITFVAPPAVTVTASPDTICVGGSSTLTANAAGNNLTYVWSNQLGTTQTVTVSQTGTYSVTVSDGSCSNTGSVTVYQHIPLQVTVSNDTTVCPGSSVVVSVNGGPFATYNWSNGAATSTITVSTAGDYWVTVNDGNCSYVSDTFNLSNYPTTTPQAFSDTNVCAGQPVVLTGDPDYSNIVWSNTMTGVSITVTTAGTYSYTATGGNGCQVTSTSVTVTHRPYPNPNITATPPAICVGQGSTTLNAGSEAGVSYVWQQGGATTPTIQVTQPGTYIVQADNNGCVRLDTLTVDAAQTPVLNLEPFTSSCCAAVTLDPAPGQNYTYVWSDSSTGSTLTITTTDNATATYSVTATNSAGCTSTASATVIINCINAVATAVPDTVMFGDSSQLNVVTDYTTEFTYVWTPSVSLTNANSQNPVASPLEETTYTVIVTDPEYGCVDTATVTVFVLYGDKIAMPNAFTPNGDGKNDVFYPVLLGDYQQVIEFRIYNRWGALVHGSTDPWNGDFSGKGQPAGTYVYYIVVRVPDPQNQGSTKDIKLNGSFTLLR